jgi:hypothetical protein
MGLGCQLSLELVETIPLCEEVPPGSSARSGHKGRESAMKRLPDADVDPLRAQPERNTACVIDLLDDTESHRVAKRRGEQDGRDARAIRRPG